MNDTCFLPGVEGNSFFPLEGVILLPDAGVVTFFLPDAGVVTSFLPDAGVVTSFLPDVGVFTSFFPGVDTSLLV